VIHGAPHVAGRIHTAAARGDEHRFALGQPFGAGGRVAEGVARLREAVYPGLELARDAKVVHGRAEHDHVGREKLAHQALGQGVFALLRFAQALALSQAQRHRVHGEVARWLRHQVQILDLGAGMAGFPGRDDFGAELARDRGGAGDGGIYVKQSHGVLLK